MKSASSTQLQDLPDRNSRGAKNQVRIRGPRPSMSISCHSIRTLKDMLQAQYDNASESLVPELIHCQYTLERNVMIALEDCPPESAESFGLDERIDNDGNSYHPISMLTAVQHIEDPKIKLRRQRAVAKQILRRLQEVDGFKYMEKEAWDTKHLDGLRFKYLCRDSYQNKDRVENKVRNGVKAEGDRDTRDLRLPTYDCKGSVFIKFSASQEIVDVIYQHLPIHRESAIPPEIHKQGRDTIEEDAQNALELLSASMPSIAMPASAADPSTKPPRSKKRKISNKSQDPPQTFIDPEIASHFESPQTPPPQDADTSITDPYDDIPAIPPALLSPQLTYDPGDGDFYRQSVVTRVPPVGLRAQFEQSVRASYDKVAAGINPIKNISTTSSSTTSIKTSSKKRKRSSTTAGTRTASTVPTVPTAPRERKPRTRTRTGCLTCRARKLKCDERRPVCRTCERSRTLRSCVFADEDPSSADASRPVSRGSGEVGEWVNEDTERRTSIASGGSEASAL